MPHPATDTSARPIRLVTWNINSVRLRLPLVSRFVQEHAPDILCLQETKVQDKDFPLAALQALGFPYIAFAGEKSYNGVAILSRVPLANIHSIDFAQTGHKRHIAATLPDGTVLHNIYIPAGGDIPDPLINPKFAMKLAYLDALHEWSATLHDNQPHLLVGDYNIAPLEHDVWSHKALLDVVSHTPVEVEKMTRLQQRTRWRDAVRTFVPEQEKSYSWWSYRARDWEAADKGRKLDHIWLTPALEETLLSAHVVKTARGWEQPSDHAPVVAHFQLSLPQAA